MKKKKRFNLSYLYPLFFLILFVILAFLLFYEKDCKSSKECFDNSFKNCDKAKVTLEEEKNIFEYRIIGSKSDNCIVKATILQVDPNARKEVIDKFEGKSMTCTLPKSQTFETGNLLQYCTGPLKEAIYELIIQKLYNILAENLGDIIASLQ
jgi:hypothetical protein